MTVWLALQAAKIIHSLTVYCRDCDAEHPAEWREVEPGKITVWLDRRVCPHLYEVTQPAGDAELARQQRARQSPPPPASP